MDLETIIVDISDALVTVDNSREPFKHFQPGVGPYGEPQLVKLIAQHLNHVPKYNSKVVTRRTPDLLIRGEWALEFKIARPFGDNGKEAEDWSVNLLHPYPGNVSLLGDCIKLINLNCPERLGVVVIGYEHNPPKISLNPLIESYEIIAKKVLGIRLSNLIEKQRGGLIHPIHQVVRIFAWEVIRDIP